LHCIRIIVVMLVVLFMFWEVTCSSACGKISSSAGMEGWRCSGLDWQSEGCGFDSWLGSGFIKLGKLLTPLSSSPTTTQMGQKTAHDLLKGVEGRSGNVGWKSRRCFFWALPKRSIPKPDQHRKDIISFNKSC